MYKIYRLMCLDEYNSVSNEFPISWKSKFKWFTDNIEFLERVSDCSFNNSAFKAKYTHLVVYEFEDLLYTKRVSTNELMLRRHDQPKIGKIKVTKIGINWRNQNV